MKSPALSVILVNPEVPENVGFVARVCANFGVTDLRIVTQGTISTAESALRTAVHAAPLLKAARIFTRLPEALSDISWSIGFSCKTSDPRHPTTPIGNIEIPSYLDHVGLVFGCENHGLTREDLELCQVVASLPTSEEYPSMNLSHAVAVSLFGLTQHQTRDVSTSQSEPISTGADRARLLSMWTDYLQTIGFTHPGNQNHIEHDLRRLVSRLHPSEREVRLLMGMIHQAHWSHSRSTTIQSAESKKPHGSLEQN